jgi:FHS family L-fucose permease-like MFS transporter
MTSTERETRSLFPAGSGLPFFLVTALFFLWGIPNNLNDVLIRQFMKSFEITRFEAGLIQFAFYLGYFVLAIPAGLLMRKLGYKAGLIVGLILYGVGALLFWPAALVGRYSFFLVALFVIASGLSFLETGANPFIAQCGDPETSERRLNFSQAFNPFGTITGALVGTIFIFSGVELNPQQVSAMRAAHTYEAYLRVETLRVIRPYAVLGIVVLAWAVLIARTKFPAIADETETRDAGRGKVRDLLRQPHFILAVLAQFLYVGAQVGAWRYFITYVQDYTHVQITGYLLMGTGVAFVVGRFVLPYLMRFFAPTRLMGTYILINLALIGVGIFLPRWIGLWAVFLTSVFMSLMFPTIFALGFKGLGASTKNVRDLLRQRHFILAVLAQFLYVGAQVGTWSYFITYVQDYTHEPEKIAGYFLTGTLVAFGVGRFVSSYLMKFIAPTRLMGTYSLINVGLIGVGVFLPGWIGLWAIFLTSVFMSLMFPTIFALGLKGLGANTKIAGSLLVMAIIGGALFPPAIGLLSEKLGSLALAFALLLPAYAFIAYYAFLGSKPRLSQQA